jgi:hypothetical protein
MGYSPRGLDGAGHEAGAAHVTLSRDRRLASPLKLFESGSATARTRPDGLIVLPDPSTNTQRKLIVELAARHRLPVTP